MEDGTVSKRRRKITTPHPRYTYPVLHELLLVLVALALLAIVGVAAAGSDVVQDAAHGGTSVAVYP